MKESHLEHIAKKIRNKLIYFIHTELKKKLKKGQNILINSLSFKELNDKYEKCSDYCVRKIETYSSSQMNNGIDYNNYYHVSLTYDSFNNNYHMLIDNRDIDQIIGKNNIIGKYYKGNSVHIRTTTDKLKYNIIKGENKFEKIIIGKKKFMSRRKTLFSSLEVTKIISLNDNDNNENNDNNNNFLNNLNSNHDNYKKVINLNMNNDNKKINTNFVRKGRKSKNQNIVNIYTMKLKNYCATLKILKKKGSNLNQLKSQKNDLPSPSMNEVKKKYKRGYTIRCGKDKVQMHMPMFALKGMNSERFKTENQYEDQSKVNNESIRKLKSQVKIMHNQKQEKKILHKKNRAQSIDKATEKMLFPKKISSPKKIINSVRVNNEKELNLVQKLNKKGRRKDSNSIRKYISGGIVNKRKMFNNVNFKYSNNVNGGIALLNKFKNEGMPKRPINKRLKRANTGINKIYKFKGSEIKLKENN
jgi:hypothetical protein